MWTRIVSGSKLQPPALVGDAGGGRYAIDCRGVFAGDTDGAQNAKGVGENALQLLCCIRPSQVRSVGHCVSPQLPNGRHWYACVPVYSSD